MTTPSKDPTPILAHARWLRSLAANLVADPASADDLAQDTTLAALRSDPEPDRPLKGWLATVLRNLRRQRWREELRRTARESEAARDEAVPSAAELVERLQSHRRVVEAVERLDEPYRSTVLLRFFEERPPREIAERLGIPEETVRTRLKRALAILRRRLDAEKGADGRSWALALLPLGTGAEGIPVAILGALLVNVKLVLVSSSLLVVAVTTVMLWNSAPSTEAHSADRSTVAAPPDPSAPERTATSTPEPRRETARSAPAESVRSAPAPAATPAAKPVASGDDAVHGRVLDVIGQPIAGVDVASLTNGFGERVEAIGATARTASDGSFTLPGAVQRNVGVTSDALVNVYCGYTSTRTDSNVIVVAAPALSLAGVVVDENQRPIADARVDVALPADLRGRVQAVLDHSLEQSFATTSDAAGAYRLEKVPQIPGATVTARSAGFEPALVALPPASTDGLSLVLRTRHPAGRTVNGQVVDSAGALVPDARVTLRGEITMTDELGRFSLDVDDTAWTKRISAAVGAPEARVTEYLAAQGFGRSSPAGARLVAAKKGFLPGVFEAPLGADGPVLPSFIVLTLGASPLAIAGTVIGFDGQPLAGATVWIDDPTPFGLDGDGGPVTTESIVTGKQEPWNRTSTGADGRFRLNGLVSRSYRVTAMHEATLLRMSAAAVKAGAEDVVLVMPKGAIHDRVTGRVVNHRNDPIANAAVHTQCDSFSVSGSTWHSAGEPVLTDDDGKFEIRDVPKDGVYLRIDGEGILPLEYGRARPRLEDEGGRVVDMVIRVSRRVHLRLELGPSAVADAFAVLDPEGEELPIDLVSGNGRRTMERMAVDVGVVSVPDDATWLVLFRDGQEIHRKTLELEPGEVNVVRP